MRIKPNRLHRKSLDRSEPTPHHIVFLRCSLLWALFTSPLWIPHAYIFVFGKPEAPSAFEYVKK